MVISSWFHLLLSRILFDTFKLPTSRRRFDGMVKEIEQEARWGLEGFDALDDIPAVV